MADTPKTEPPKIDAAKPGKGKPADKQAASSRPDLATIGGIVLAVGGILGGLLMEGGKIKDISQITAAIIVLGGTLGAVMVSTPISVLKGAVQRIINIVLDKTQPPDAAIEELIGYATKARKNGLVSLESEAMEIQDPFLKKALTLAVDGTDLQEIRNMMQLDMDICDSRAQAEARVFECGGGYSPTIGIIGAVMGLITVMANLSDPSKLGSGIATAFVATVYGVGSANLLFLPIAGKLKLLVKGRVRTMEMVLEGLVGMAVMEKPLHLELRLRSFVEGGGEAPEEGDGAGAGAAGAPLEQSR
jgi:chemotaxis protein MotA